MRSRQCLMLLLILMPLAAPTLGFAQALAKPSTSTPGMTEADVVGAWGAELDYPGHPDPVHDTGGTWDPGAAGWAGRLVVGEYTTGVFCGICQEHDDAFNTLLRRYPRTAFVSLAYHFAPNLPLADPADSTFDHLWHWYGANKLPAILDHQPTRGDDDWIDGHSADSYIDLGGLMSGTSAAHRTARLVRAVEAELKRPPEAFLHVAPRVVGGTVAVQVTVDSILGAHPQTYLRLALVEDTVRFVHSQTWYKQRLQASEAGAPLRSEHHMVVRAVAHAGLLPLGLPLSGPGTVQYTFDVAAIQQRHLQYHAQGLAALRPYLPADLTDSTNLALLRQIHGGFPDARDWRLDPRRLHVVAFVQDAHTGAVLQTVMVTVPDSLQLP